MLKKISGIIFFLGIFFIMYLLVMIYFKDLKTDKKQINQEKKTAENSIKSIQQDKQIFEYIERFEKNDKKWYETSEKSKEEQLYIQDGKYNIKSTKVPFASYKKYWNEDQSDFEVESLIKINKGEKGIAILFGGKKKEEKLSSYYLFGINNKQEYFLYKVEDEKFDLIFLSMKMSQIKIKQTNKLKIRQINGKIEFFLNNYFVESISKDEKMGGIFGVYADELIEAELDNFIIRKRNTKQEEKAEILIENEGQLHVIKEKIIFQDFFEDNKNMWTVGENEKYSFEISENKYKIHAKKGAWRVSQTTVIESDEDFTIESELTKVSGLDTNTYNIMFGRDSLGNCYVFGISGKGSYRYSTYKVGEGWEDIIAMTHSDTIKVGEKNKIKLYTKEDMIHFEINDELVNKMDFPGIFGDKIGFHINEGISVEVDSILAKKVYK